MVKKTRQRRDVPITNDVRLCNVPSDIMVPLRATSEETRVSQGNLIINFLIKKGFAKTLTTKK